jgi:hypothetical protein
MYSASASSQAMSSSAFEESILRVLRVGKPARRLLVLRPEGWSTGGVGAESFYDAAYPLPTRRFFKGRSEGENSSLPVGMFRGAGRWLVMGS